MNAPRGRFAGDETLDVCGADAAEWFSVQRESLYVNGYASAAANDRKPPLAGPREQAQTGRLGNPQNIEANFDNSAPRK